MSTTDAQRWGGQITMRFTQLDVREFPLENAYKFNEKKKYWWKPVAQWLFEFLKRRGALSLGTGREMVVAQQIVLDEKQAADKIVQMAHAQLLQITYGGRRPKRIFVGPKQLQELALNQFDKERFVRPIYFDIDIHWNSRPERWQDDPAWMYRSGYSTFNVPVEVIPWMEGVLVI